MATTMKIQALFSKKGPKAPVAKPGTKKTVAKPAPKTVKKTVAKPAPRSKPAGGRRCVLC